MTITGGRQTHNLPIWYQAMTEEKEEHTKLPKSKDFWADHEGGPVKDKKETAENWKRRKEDDKPKKAAPKKK